MVATNEGQAAGIERGLRVLRAWAGGQRDNLPLAMQEAKLIIEQDGDADTLLEGLISVAGFLLVNLEEHGQRDADSLALLEAFRQALEGGTQG